MQNAANYPNDIPQHWKDIEVQLDDISTPGQIFVVPGFDGKITRIFAVINGAISGADAVLTAKINGTAVENGTITIANTGSAAGDSYRAVPSKEHYFREGDAIEIETDGGSTGTVAAVITMYTESGT